MFWAILILYIRNVNAQYTNSGIAIIITDTYKCLEKNYVDAYIVPAYFISQ